MARRSRAVSLVGRHTTRRRGLGVEPHRFSRGWSTAHAGVPEYRIQKLERLGVVQGRWLDLGCADGYYAHVLRIRGASEVTGVDLDERAVAKAQELWGQTSGIDFAVGPAERLPFADRSFDGVLMNEVLEHLPDEHAALVEARRVLVPNGCLAAFSPNRWFPFEGHGAQFGTRFVPYPVPILPWLPRSISGRFMIARNYWPRELAKTVSTAGFDVVRVDFAFPLIHKFRWAPAGLLERYTRQLPVIEQLPIVRRLGISTLIVARRRGCPGETPPRTESGVAGSSIAGDNASGDPTRASGRL